MNSRLSILASFFFISSAMASDKPWVRHPIGQTTQYCVDTKFDFSGDKLPGDMTISDGSTYTIANNTLTLNMKQGQDGRGVGSTVSNGLWFSQYMTIRADVRFQFAVGAVYTLIMRAAGTNEGRDEIDFEWLREPTVVETNIFGNGHVIYGTWGGKHTVPNVEQWTTYEISWNEDRITWSVCPEGNGACQVLRTLEGKDTFHDGPDKDGKPVKDWLFPTSPMRVEFGIWDSSSEWSGGKIDWKQFPNGINYSIRNLMIKCMQPNNMKGTGTTTDDNTNKPDPNINKPVGDDVKPGKETHDTTVGDEVKPGKENTDTVVGDHIGIDEGGDDKTTNDGPQIIDISTTEIGTIISEILNADSGCNGSTETVVTVDGTDGEHNGTPTSGPNTDGVETDPSNTEDPTNGTDSGDNTTELTTDFPVTEDPTSSTELAKDCPIDRPECNSASRTSIWGALAVAAGGAGLLALL